MPFAAKSVTLAELFSGYGRYETPIYQRPYSWTTAEVARFLEHLLYHFERHRDGDASGGEFFLGTIVLMGPKGSLGRRILSRFSTVAAYDIVDGQQRLVTLTILLAALRDKAREAASTGLADGLHVLIALPASAGEAPEYRIAIAGADNDFFAAHCQGIGGCLSEISAEDVIGAKANLIAAREQVMDTIEELSPELRQQLAAFVKQHCYLVQITSPDIDNAYRVFTVVNQLGRALLAQDILKAELLEALPAGEREAYAQRWAQSLARVGGSDAYERFLGEFRSVYGSGRRPIIAEIREIVEQQGNVKRFLDNLFLPAADIYAVLVGREGERFVLPDRARDLLTYLGWVGHSDWKPAVLLWSIRNRAQPALIVDLLAAIERFTLGHKILGTAGQTRVTAFNRVLAAIRSENVVPHDRLELSEEEQRNILYTIANGGKKKGGRICKIILLRMNDHAAGRSMGLEPDQVTLEHVLPEGVARTSEWRLIFTDGEREHYWRSIGNMIPLGLNANREGRNAPFGRKLEAYAKDPYLAQLPICNDVLAASRWGPEEIQAREDRLLDVARAMWSLRGRINRRPPD